MSGTGVPLNPISERQQDFDNIDYLNVIEPNIQKPAKSSGSKMGTSLSCIGMLWSLFSFLSMLATFVGFFMPFWITGHLSAPERPNQTAATHFGLWRRCNYLILTKRDTLDIQEACGRYADFTDIPTIWWKIATVLVGVGCALSVFISFLGLLTCCISKVMSKNLAKTTAVFQFIAALCVTAGCVLYPFGWENNLELQQACGPEVSVFRLATCSISWAYWLTIGGASGTLLCSLLACHANKPETRIRYHAVGLQPDRV